jgi:uncharacterized protein YcfJ
MDRFTPGAIAFAVALGGTVAAKATDFATVVSSTPMTASVPVARQLCGDAQQLVQQRPSGAGAVIGAIAGGVIGHNLGNGFGRAAATGLGVITGSVLGDQVEAANTPVVEMPVRRCQTVSSYETRVVAYDVLYEYAGQRYSTRLARDPGRQLAVNVQPADNGGLPVPTNAAGDGSPLPTYAPQTVYYALAPQAVYYDPAPIYVAPAISFGFGYYGGYRGHWH